MSRPDEPAGAPSGGDGSTTAAEGTPVAVDVSRDRRARIVWVVFLAGPVVWFGHFMLVYLVVEAGCSGGGPGLAVFDPPVPTAVTLVATAVAAVACLWSGWWGYRRWRVATRERRTAGDWPWEAQHDGRSAMLAFSGLLLSLLSLVAVLLVGLPAAVLPAC